MPLDRPRLARHRPRRPFASTLVAALLACTGAAADEATPVRPDTIAALGYRIVVDPPDALTANEAAALVAVRDRDALGPWCRAARARVESAGNGTLYCGAIENERGIDFFAFLGPPRPRIDLPTRSCLPPAVSTALEDALDDVRAATLDELRAGRAVASRPVDGRLVFESAPLAAASRRVEAVLASERDAIRRAAFAPTRCDDADLALRALEWDRERDRVLDAAPARFDDLPVAIVNLWIRLAFDAVGASDGAPPDAGVPTRIVAAGLERGDPILLTKSWLLADALAARGVTIAMRPVDCERLRRLANFGDGTFGPAARAALAAGSCPR